MGALKVAKIRDPSLENTMEDSVGTGNAPLVIVMFKVPLLMLAREGAAIIL